MKSCDSDYWENRWIQGRTGWHKTYVEPLLQVACVLITVDLDMTIIEYL